MPEPLDPFMEHARGEGPHRSTGRRVTGPPRAAMLRSMRHEGWRWNEPVEAARPAQPDSGAARPRMSRTSETALETVIEAHLLNHGCVASVLLLSVRHRDWSMVGRWSVGARLNDTTVRCHVPSARGPCQVTDMDAPRYQLRLAGLAENAGHIRMAALQRVLRALLQTAERGPPVSLATGAGTGSGQRPAWLDAASETEPLDFVGSARPTDDPGAVGTEMRRIVHRRCWRRERP